MLDHEQTQNQPQNQSNNHKDEEKYNLASTIFCAQWPDMLGQNFIHLKHINGINTEKGTQ